MTTPSLPELPEPWATVLDTIGLPVEVYRRFEMLTFARSALAADRAATAPATSRSFDNATSLDDFRGAVACVVETAPESFWLCWSNIAEQTYADRPRLYLTAPDRAANSLAAPEPDVYGMPFSQAKAVILKMNADDARSMAISLLISLGLERKYAAAPSVPPVGVAEQVSVLTGPLDAQAFQTCPRAPTGPCAGCDVFGGCPEYCRCGRPPVVAAPVALREALTGLVGVIEAAGLQNLANGVQFGPTVWFVKASDALQAAHAALDLPPVGVGREAEHGSVDSVESSSLPAAALGQGTDDEPDDCNDAVSGFVWRKL